MFSDAQHRTIENEQYKALVIDLIRTNWAAEAANLSLSMHDQVCPLRLAPTAADRAVLAGYWADECRHATMFAGLLEDLGAGPSDGEYEELRPAELLRLPVRSWVVFSLFQLFADSAGCIHLEDYSECSYLPLRRTAATILRDERRHVGLGLRALSGELERGRRDLAQELLPTWYSAALGLFGRAGHVSTKNLRMMEAGLRKSTNDELRLRYREMVDTHLHRFDLAPPSLA